MLLKHLSLTNFRNFTRLELELPARVAVLQGENAQGKTNLLEAIYYLATTKSPLASSDRQLINWAADDDVIPFADVQAVFVRDDTEHSIAVTLVKERQLGDADDAMRFRRQIHFDGVPRRAMDVVGRLNVVLFLPQDITLISGSPSGRRRYLDITLCQIDRTYCRTLSRYNRIVTQRNALLRRIREGQAGPNELNYWDAQLAEAGAFVLARRLWALGELNREIDTLHAELTGGQEHLVAEYQDSIASRGQAQVPDGEGTPGGADGGQVDPTHVEALAGVFRQALIAVRAEEIARAMTIVGPHRDDIRFLINGIDATIYGSRGQQRTAALALKLAEVALMRNETSEMPVLLLDDVVSELDQHRCGFLLETISHAQQVLITTTDLGFYANGFLDAATVWRVAGGTVAP